MTPPQSKASSRRPVEGELLISSLVSSDRTWGNGMELHWLRLRLNIRERLSNQRVVGHWNRVSREASQEFKECLDDALSHIV